MKRTKTMLIAASFLLLSGCFAATQYRYAPPPGGETPCFSACRGLLAQCRQYALDHYDQCMALYRSGSGSYDDCLRAGGEYHGQCLPPLLCRPPDDERCVAHYNDCWRNCGGTVEEAQGAF